MPRAAAHGRCPWPCGTLAMGLHVYPKAARPTKTDEFSFVFALRPVRRSCHFALHACANGNHLARLGAVIGKKFAKHAVERNLIKRQRRELFRLWQPLLGGRGVSIRLQVKFPRQDVPAMATFKRIRREELAQLLEVVTRPLSAPSAVTPPQSIAGSTP